MKLVKIAEEYLEHINRQDLSEKTKKGYAIDTVILRRWLNSTDRSDISILDFNRRVIRDYIDYLQTKYKYKTIQRRLTVLKCIINYAYEYGYIDTNPFYGMHIKIKNHDPLPSVMELGEVNRFLYAVHNKPTRNYGDYTHLRDVALIEVLFSTGMRNEEIASLKKENWDQLQHQFRFSGKGRKIRTIYIDNVEVLRALQEYMDAVNHIESEYIFINKFGEKMSTAAVRDVVNKYSKQAGINYKKITPHTFRRSFATLLIQSGLDISYVQQALGHASITTTQLYIRLSEEATRKAIRSVNPRDAMSFI